MLIALLQAGHLILFNISAFVWLSRSFSQLVPFGVGTRTALRS